MAGRTLLPIMAVAALGGVTVSLGLGYGLGQYTVSGINPFYATATTTWQPDRVRAAPADDSRAGQQFAAVFAPETSDY